MVSNGTEKWSICHTKAGLLTSRERVLTALRHEVPDRVPRLLYEEVVGYPPALQKMLGDKCAPLSPSEYFLMDIASVSLQPTRLSRDRFSPWYAAHPEALARGQVDEWGVWRQPGSFHHFSHIESPLRDVDDFGELQRFPWPDRDQPERFIGLKDQIDRLHDRGLAVAGRAGSIFEQAWYIRGMESLLADFLTEPVKARYFLERAAYYQRVIAEQLTRLGVDIIITGDDVAGQTGLLMSIEVWSDFLKPLQKATVNAVKRINKEAKVFYHSDGNIVPLIPDLIDTGIDILNPLQPECLDPAEVKKQYGHQLSFWGAVSVQRTLSCGSPSEVDAEVRERVKTVGAGGGYILAPAHILGPETPWENIVAFFKAADEC